MKWHSPYTRRQALLLAAKLGAGVALSAACAPQPARPTEAPKPTAKAAEAPKAAAPQAAPAAKAPEKLAAEAPQKIVGDTLDFKLESEGRWKGPFGSVSLKLHKGLFDDKDAWFIRTDASDAGFAREQGLVFVPLMTAALQAPGSFASLYLFGQGASGQAPVLTTIPGRENYTPAFRVHRVAFSGTPELLTSEPAIKAAEAGGKLKIEQTSIIVNYPLVKWPGGGLPKDGELMESLGKGPLIEEPDTTGGKVVFKLHQCFPGSRYIVTDTSAVPMAPMMGVVGSAPTQKLKDAKAVAPITIFVNGLKGPGVMGFQPAIFNAKAGEAAWSPFWDHFAAKWKDPSKAVVVRSQAELDAKIAAGEIERFNGTPDTHPMGFVVNCPSPVLAPNTYTGA
jgi:hypothetical protein